MPTSALEGLTLHVADIERSIAFYSKVPGTDLKLHIPGQFAIFMIGRGRLGLLKVGAPSAAEGSQVASSTPDAKAVPYPQTKFHVEIETDDLDAMYAAVIHAGLTPNGPPIMHEWGQRDFLVFDPDGNMLEFGVANDF